MFAYIITNALSGKQYVGVTRRTVEARWKAHKRAAANGFVRSALCRAIRRHGVENFSVETVLCVIPTGDASQDWAASCEAERALIADRGTFGSGGYNMTRGGDGLRGFPKTSAQLNNSRSPEARAKISASRQGEKNPMFGRSGKLAPAFGLKRSPESIQRNRESARITRADPAWREWLSSIRKGKNTGATNPMHGKTHSAEVRAKMSAKVLAHYATGAPHPRLGKKLTEEERQKLRDGWARRRLRLAAASGSDAGAVVT